MNIKRLKSQGFVLALPIVFASAFGGCASQQTPMQTAEAQVAQPVKTQVVKHQPVKAHLMRLVVQRPSERQVYKGVVAALTFSPDSKTLASAGSTAKNNVVYGAARRAYRVLDRLPSAADLGVLSQI